MIHYFIILGENFISVIYFWWPNGKINRSKIAAPKLLNSTGYTNIDYLEKLAYFVPYAMMGYMTEGGIRSQLQAAAQDLICRAEQAVIADFVKAPWESVLEEAAQ